MSSRLVKPSVDHPKLSHAMQRFFGAAILLGLALLGFFALMLPLSEAPKSVPGKQVDILDQLAESKQIMLRQAMRMEAARLRQEAGGNDGSALKGLLVGMAPAPAPVPGTAVIGNDLDAEIQKAIRSVDAGNISEAVAILEELLKRNPRHEQALVEMAMIQILDLKQNGAAITYLQRAMDVNPDNKVVMSELVTMYEEEGRVDEGLNFLMERVSAHPESTELSYSIGQLLALQGREGDAIPYLEKAAQQSDNPVRAYRDLAEAYSRNGESDRAVDAYNKTILEQEKDIKAKAQQGMPTTFAEERLNNTKLDQVRELIRRGDSASLEMAEKVLDEVQASMPDLEQIAALQKALASKRQG